MCFKWLENMTKKMAKTMKWYDISLLKLSVFFATLFLVTAFEGFRNLVLGIEWYWYLALMIVAALPLLKKMYID